MFNTNQWKGPNIVPDIVVLHFYESISFSQLLILLVAAIYGCVRMVEMFPFLRRINIGLLDRESEPKRFVIPSSRLEIPIG